MAEVDSAAAFEARQLREAVKELTEEFRAFRTETAQTFVRQDTHLRDLQILRADFTASQSLLTQTLISLKESMESRVETIEDRVDKTDGDADWIKKIVYSAIILAVLATVGLTGAAGAGVLK